jgi:hypothetical protein
MPKYLKILIACTICLGVAAGIAWLLQRMFG